MLGTGEKIIASFPAKKALMIALAVQFIGAIIIAYVTTHLIEWPFLRWRESIAWLRDTKPIDLGRKDLAVVTMASPESTGA